MRILHIHSDKKFLYEISMYNHPSIQNTVIFLGEPFESSYHLLFYNKNIRSLKKIAIIAEKYDMVVFMSMSIQQAVICNMLPSNIKVIWRFFGGELYMHLSQYILTSKSLAFYRRKTIHDLFSVLKNTLIYGHSADFLFWKAVNRCDAFLGLSDIEYDYLKCYFPHLPQFLNTPFNEIQIEINFDKEPLIIVGHSADIYGNHLDVIELIKESSHKDDFRFCAFLSYGVSNKPYYDEIVKQCETIKTMELITDFLPLETFYKIEDSASALVINSIRQLAMGNIFSALRRGVKVYLNPANVMYHWFEKFNIKIFSVEELKVDLDNNNIQLTYGEMESNMAAMNNLSKIFSTDSFCKQLMMLNKIA